MRPIKMRFVLTILIFTTLSATVFSQNISVENVSYKIINEEIIINFDLNGDQNKKYSIILSLKRESDTKMVYNPINVSGDVGSGINVGKGKEITWKIKKEFPEGLEGTDYYFEVETEEISEGILWYYYASGAVVTGLAILLFSSGQDEVETLVPSISDPPNRP